MLRIAGARILQRSQQSGKNVRNLVTSAQKRALNKNQIKGNAESAPVATSKTTSKSTGKDSVPTAGNDKGGSGSGMLMGGALVILAGGAIAYQQNLLDDFLGTSEKIVHSAEVAVDSTPTKGEESKSSTQSDETKEELMEVPAIAESTEQETSTSEGNQVTIEDMALAFPPKVNRTIPAVLPVEHDPHGNRVSVEQLNQNFPLYNAGLTNDTNYESVKADTQSESLPTVIASKTVKEPEPEIKEESSISITTAIEAAKELQTSSVADSTSDLHKAVLLLRKDLDQSYLDDLDSLSNTELKIRLIRMVNDMTDRGRFEAVRAKEMLDLKEKDIADKYLSILQQQRHQFEDLLSNRLREQEDALKRQTSSLLQQKDDSIQALLDATTSAQKTEHDAEIKSKLQQVEKELLATKEAEYNGLLASEKEKYTTETKEHVQQIQDLAKAVQDLQDVALASRTFQTSSQKAHTISAAAIALSNKLDTPDPLGEELATLKAVVADQDTVIQSTLAKIPKKAASKGIPTLPMLQHRFDHVWEVARTAALVPEDQVGMGAQLLGKVFSSIKYTVPISDDSAEPTGENETEWILSRAKYNVERGELDKAVQLLNKLGGKSQVGFTVKDWMSDAKDRVVLEKALKIVKMECALLNENMAKK